MSDKPHNRPDTSQSVTEGPASTSGSAASVSSDDAAVRGFGRRITLGDMALALGVSTATVSLALRDSALVATSTRKRIKAYAQDVGYIYNRSAAALRTARSNMIGVAVHDILNPYFAEVFRVLEEALGRENQVVVICNHRDGIERQRSFIDSLLQHRIDGLVLSASIGTTAEEITALADKGIPVTLICRDVPDARVPVVRGDDFAGGRMVTEHLISQGHRRIAMVGGRRASSAGRERHAGWRAALTDAGIDPDAQIDLPELMTQAEARAAVQSLLAVDPKPTALFGFNDLVALGLMSALRRSGVTPGSEVAVVGYDDIDGSASLTPALTSVWNGADEIGRRAAELILNQIAGARFPPDRILIPPRLLVRESSPAPLT